ncbi:MAG: TMEM175 family protein [Ferruginibacter sp.]
MNKNRLEAFSDGVIAIIITIMVLEMKVPHSANLESLKELIPVFISYVLSFVYVAIYWNNHHHMLHATRQVNGLVLWENVHLLFWLSLIPFTSGWMGENHFAKWPVILYGVNLLMCAIAYSILAVGLGKLHGKDSTLARALGKDYKGKLSIVIYILGLVSAFFDSRIAFVLYVVVACIWFIPDKRIERVIIEEQVVGNKE